MPSAEIITIGTELLLGEIADTNTRFLARCLRDAGIDLYRTTTVGDNVNRIAQAIRQSLERSDIVITTGGLGPTVDDPTREAVALALGVDSVFHPELWDQIKTRFQKLGRLPTENNRRQAYIPQGAQGLENPVGTAPIFVVENGTHLIVSLPGVPGEMEYLMVHSILPILQQHYDLHSIIKTRLLHTVGAGESLIDERISDLERLNNPTVGLAAHSGQVDVRIAVKADSLSMAEQLIQPVEADLRSRLGDWIYGTDLETLEEVSLRSLAHNQWTLSVVEAGLGGKLISRLVKAGGIYLSGQVLNCDLSADELQQETDTYRISQHADVGLGVVVKLSPQAQSVHGVLITPLNNQQFDRRYAGPLEYVNSWAINFCLDLLRRIPHDDKS